MGILVMGTLHTNGAAPTVDRMVNAFPADKQQHVRAMLSTSLRGVISQQLIPRAGKPGRVAALEIMLNTPRIQALIRRGELETIRQAIEEGLNDGLQTLDQALLKLFQEKKITQESALQFADSPNNLRLRIKGIK
jgi:twitching motility protein PilT